MASLKEIKNRINSIKSTHKITSAMKMVASAKLHKAQGAIGSLLPYQNKINRMLTNFLGLTDTTIQSPYAVQREVKRVGIIVFSSNSSLCGAFNSNVIKRFIEVADRYKGLGQENILIYPVGKKIEEALKKMGYELQDTFQDMADKPSYEAAANLAVRVMDEFISGELDKVEIIYHHFRSMGAQLLIDDTYLPLDLDQIKEEARRERDENERKSKFTTSVDYIVEPSVDEFVTSLLPTVLRLKMYTSLLDSNASEHAARMLAMQIATDNADELIKDLTKQYNKSRQQAITNELLDIIGGSMR